MRQNESCGINWINAFHITFKACAYSKLTFTSLLQKRLRRSMYYGLLISSYECRMIWHWQFGSTSVYQIIEIASRAPIWQGRAGMKRDSQKPAGVIMTHFLPSVIICILCLGATSCFHLKYIWHVLLFHSFYLLLDENKKFFCSAFHFSNYCVFLPIFSAQIFWYFSNSEIITNWPSPPSLGHSLYLLMTILFILHDFLVVSYSSLTWYFDR